MRAKTIFCDIDGTLIKHWDSIETCKPDHNPEILDGTLSKLLEWDKKGYKIILTTGRKESMRKQTKKQLERLGVIYDILIMGIGGGERVLINDSKAGEITATAICLPRDRGIKDVNI